MTILAGNSVNMEGAMPTEQELNQPKPSKRARTSFTADQLQVLLCPPSCSMLSSPCSGSPLFDSSLFLKKKNAGLL